MVEDIESRPHKAVTFVVERGKGRQEWNEQKLPKTLPVYSGGRLPGRGTEQKGREQGEEHEGSEERRERNEMVSQMMAWEEGCISARKRTEGQNPIQGWDCSQIENEEEEESRQESDQMAEQ